VSGVDRDHIEREVKLDADPDLVLPDLDGVSPGVSARHLSPVQLDATYFDAVDLRLMANGITVRRRTGEGTRWTVKLPAGEPGDDGALARREVDVVDAALVPPSLVLDMVGPWLAEAPLVAVARLVSSRRRVELRVTEPAEAVVAELDDDLVVVHDDAGEVGRFREIEVEMAPVPPGADADALDATVDAVVARLVRAGARHGGSRPKVERALALIAR
jgi:hypothetical protein